jgi:hypothetical protein
MVLALVLVAGSAIADNGELVGGGRSDDTGNMGSGCCASSTQSSGGYYGSGHAASQDDGGHLGSGVGAQSAKAERPGVFAQFYAFLLSLFA